MGENKLIGRFERQLNKMNGLQQLYFLVAERKKLDDGIFSEIGWKDSSYKDEIIQMLHAGDIAKSKLEIYFPEYKEKWDQAKRKFFDSTDTLGYKAFLESFGDYLPQDISESIKRVGDTNIDQLDLNDSIKIFKNYFELRNWLNQEIQIKLDENKLSDKEIQLQLGTIKDKYEWLGTPTELVGLFNHLQSNKWLHDSESSQRNKAIKLLSCFTIIGTKDSINYIHKIYKESLEVTKPFEGIGTKL